MCIGVSLHTLAYGKINAGPGQYFSIYTFTLGLGGIQYQEHCYAYICGLSKMFVHPHSSEQKFGHLAQMKLVQMGVSPNGG